MLVASCASICTVYCVCGVSSQVSNDCGLCLDQVSEEEVLILTSAYAQARLAFVVNRPGDTIVLDNRRFAHGRMPFTGNRKVAAFMGNVGCLNK